MAISTNGTVLARVAGALYNTQMSNATYKEVASLDPATLMNTLYARDFSSSTDAAVATTLVTNLGLSAVAGLNNWVAAQLTAAGSAKGAKVVDLLNSFAQMTADTTYGAYATAFNTKVDAALALSQTTDNKGGTFAAAGVVVVADAVFTLTAGVDSVVGGAGNDTIIASNATMTTYDTVDGGAGVNTLSIAETSAVTGLTGTFSNIQKASITTTGAVGVGAISTSNASAAVTTLTANSAVTTGTVVLQIGSVQVTAATGSDANIAAAATSALQSLGYTVVTSGATASQVTVAAAAGVVTVTGKADGSALPSIAVVSGAAANLPAIAVAAGAAAVTAVDAAALSLSGLTGLTSATVAAGTSAYISAGKTTDLTITAGTVASVTGGQNDVVTGKGGVTVKSATGTVTITEKSSGAVAVEGGTTVSITKTGSALSSTTGQPSGSAYAGNITVGADSSYSNTSISADGYPQLDANVKKQPTGDITIKNYTNYTDTTGAASRVYGSGTADVYSNGAANVTVATAGAITIKDVQVNTRVLVNGATAVKGSQTLSSATIDGAGSTAAITSDALTALKVINTGGSAAVTVTNAKTGGHALALTVGNNTTGTAVTDDTATSVTVGTEAQTISSAANASKAFVDLNAAVATSLTFNNAQAVELTGASSAAFNGATKVTSIVATGSGALTLNKVADATKLTSIDASGASGALKVTIPATSNYGLTVKGGSGADTVTLDGAIASQVVNGATVTTSVDLGAGNDTVLKGTSGSIGAGSYVNGGDGVDTIAATLLNAGNASLISNFEVLGLDVASGNYDTDLLVGATGLSALAVGGTYTNVNTPQGITYGKDLSSGSITLTFGTAEATGTADAYSVTLAGKAGSSATAVSQDGLNAQTLSIDNIEAVTVNSTGTGFIANTINVFDTKARTLTITGDKDLTITLGDGSSTTATFGTAGQSTDSNGLSLIDGSTATGKLSINTGDVGVAYAGLTVKGGSNNDAIVLAQEATVDAGAGNDTITTAASTNSVLTLGAGKDTVVATTTAYSTGYLTTITDLAVGDKIDFLAATTAGSAVVVGSKVTLGSSVTTLAAALDAAANSGGSSGAEINWFQYGGNTYVIFDAAASNSANISSSDVVVKLTGLVDLSTSTFDATQGLLIVA